MPISPEQLESIIAETNARFGAPPPRQSADPLDSMDTRDLAEMLPDLLKIRAGISVSRPHPLARAMVRQGETLDGLKQRSGLTSSDFGQAMADGLSVLAATGFDNSTGDIRAVVRNLTVSDFRSVELPALSLPEPEEEFENSDMVDLKPIIAESARAGQLRTFSGRLKFSRAVWSVWSDEIFMSVQSHARSVFPRIERRLLASALESATWPTATGALGLTGLDAAAKALRDATTPTGEKSGLGIHGLIVPSALEMAARKLRADLAWSELRIVVLPDLSGDTRWFVCADPVVSAPLVRLQLAGAGRPVVLYDRKRGGRYAISHDVDYVGTPTVPGVVECAP